MTFQIGDVVQLKSGGPKMTVEDVGQNAIGADTVWCSWFDGNKKVQGTFAPQALQKV
jgi:uncharacterized protein YodC (DUF2158 family)